MDFWTFAAIVLCVGCVSTAAADIVASICAYKERKLNAKGGDHG